MNQQITLFGDTASIADLAGRAISAVVNGDISPIEAHIQISRMENAIKQFKDDTQVRDITLRELSKYGKSHQFGDCRLEEAESGVKYDYSMCGDSKLRDMYETLEALKVDIKEREMMLRSMPASGLADPETGEVLFPPARSSKTIIKTTFMRRVIRAIDMLRPLPEQSTREWDAIRRLKIFAKKQQRKYGKQGHHHRECRF